MVSHRYLLSLFAEFYKFVEESLKNESSNWTSSRLQLGTRFLTLASTGLFDMSKCVMSGTYFNPKIRKLWTCNETLCATHFPDEYPFTLYVSTPEARLVQDVSCISNVTHYLKIIITWWQGSRWCGSHSCCIYEYLPEQNWAKFRTEQLDSFRFLNVNLNLIDHNMELKEIWIGMKRMGIYWIYWKEFIGFNLKQFNTANSCKEIRCFNLLFKKFKQAVKHFCLYKLCR